jgi:hypothetical protein
MFVYRPNTLERTIEPIDATKSRVGIYHVPSKMSLSFDIYNDPQLPLSSPIQYPSKSFRDSEVSTMASRYEIKGIELSGDKYDVNKEVYNPNKTSLENFLEAIDIFENYIYNRLNEKVASARPPSNPTPPETESVLPKVTDFVRGGKRFGRVVDVDKETRAVKISQMTKEDVLRNLRGIMNQGLIKDSETFKTGGSLGLPKVGDIVATQGQYGRVIQVDKKTRRLKVQKMSREQIQKLIR